MLETLDDYKRDLEATELAREDVKRAAGSFARPATEARFSLGPVSKCEVSAMAVERDRNFLLHDASLQAELRQLARFESILERNENHAALALHHSVVAERVLREGLLDRSEPISEPILQSCERSGPRRLLESYYEKRLKPTLGLVELFGLELRRCLEASHPSVCEWVDMGFETKLPQDTSKSPRLVRSSLMDMHFCLFVGHLRERIRNPVAHGIGSTRLEFDQYQNYCRSAYGHSSLQGWVRSGLLEAGTDGPAWIATITITARRIESSLYSRALRAFKQLF